MKIRMLHRINKDYYKLVLNEQDIKLYIQKSLKLFKLNQSININRYLYKKQENNTLELPQLQVNIIKLIIKHPHKQSQFIKCHLKINQQQSKINLIIIFKHLFSITLIFHFYQYYSLNTSLFDFFLFYEPSFAISLIYKPLIQIISCQPLYLNCNYLLNRSQKKNIKSIFYYHSNIKNILIDSFKIYMLLDDLLIIYINLFQFLMYNISIISSKTKDKRKKIINRSQELSSNITQKQDIHTIYKLLMQCFNEKSVKISFIKFVNYIENFDFKRLAIINFSQEQALNVIKILNTWILQILINTNIADQLPQEIIILTQFYKHLIKKFKIKYDNQFILIGYIFYLNNIGTFLLRSKQYTMAIQFLHQAIKIYHEKQTFNHPIFSIIFTNLSTIYYLLGQQSKGQTSLLKGIKISKTLHKQFLANNDTNSLEFSQNSNILIHMYVLLLDLYQDKLTSKNRFLQAERTAMQLIINNLIKLNKKNWFIKYFFQKRKKINKRYNQSVFDSIFKISIQQLKLYTNQELLNTPKKSTMKKISGINGNSNIYQLYTTKNDKNEAYVKIENQNKYFREVISKIQNMQKRQSQVQEIVKNINILQSEKGYIDKHNTIHSVPKMTFKNALVQINFHEEGIIIKNNFSKMQERLDWDLLKNILNELQLNEYEGYEVEQNCNEYLIAKILSNHIQVTDNKIRITRLAYPDFKYKTSKCQYEFQYIGKKQFIITTRFKNNLQKKSTIFCYFQCFQRYFKIIKEDQYQLYFKNKLTKKQIKKQHPTYTINVIKLNNDPKNKSLQKDIAPLIQYLQTLPQLQNTLHYKLDLRFQQQSQQTSLSGILYKIQQNPQQNNLKFTLTKLKKYDFKNFHTQSLTKQISFSFIQQQFGLNFQKLSLFQKFTIKNILCDLNLLIAKYIKNDIIQTTHINSDPHQIVFYLIKKTIEYPVFIRKYVDKKYQRPLTLSVIGIKRKCFGIKCSMYNESFVNQDSFFIYCDQDWFNIDKDQKNRLFKQDNSILKYHIFCDLIKQIDIFKIFENLQKYKKQTKINFVPFQKFFEFIYN